MRGGQDTDTTPSQDGARPPLPSRPLPAGPGGSMRIPPAGPAGSMGRTWGAPVPTGPSGSGAAPPTGPRGGVGGPVPTGPRSSASTASRRDARTYRDKDKDRVPEQSSVPEGLDYGGGAGGSERADDDRGSPARSRSRRDSPDYGRNSSRYERDRSRDRRDRDREYEKERARERERERDRERDPGSGRRDDDRGSSRRSGGDDDMGRGESPALRIRGARERDEERSGGGGSTSRNGGRSGDAGDFGGASGETRSRGTTYSPEGTRSRRTQWSDDEGDYPADDSRYVTSHSPSKPGRDLTVLPCPWTRKRKAETEAEEDRPRRRSSRRV